MRVIELDLWFNATKAAVEQSCAHTVASSVVVAFTARDINLNGNIALTMNSVNNFSVPMFTTQLTSFANKSLIAEEMVVLFSAHTVSYSFCTLYTNCSMEVQVHQQLWHSAVPIDISFACPPGARQIAWSSSKCLSASDDGEKQSRATRLLVKREKFEFTT